MMKLSSTLLFASVLGISTLLTSVADAKPKSKSKSSYHHHHHDHSRKYRVVKAWVKGHSVWHRGHKHWVPGHYEFRKIYF